MLRALALMCLVVSIATGLHRSSARQQRKAIGDVARKDSEIIIDNNENPLVSYVKLHPG
jgi:hypothetical protein